MSLTCALCLNKSTDDSPIEQTPEDFHIYGGKLPWRSYAVRETLENGTSLWIRIPNTKKCLPCHNVLRTSGFLLIHKATKKYLKWSEAEPVRHHPFLELRKKWIKRHSKGGLRRLNRNELKRERH